ncbi:site-specific DNA-methyltransferase [Aureisphaera sp. CAU 1614]|uniref:site-specific DNA-methyltransferase (adenine-specific) n=1 Tax=Halomarinibacterium sedimenti TaxID=2857106 RepID=A0A9X1JYH8_9FLAO|nr:site-specific DNA-methyltransferase [Halomarinibacterium sedimenti]MBW2937532.1 site-specific DNA-methyltransferase [Halomarinibacterium sedimenti]
MAHEKLRPEFTFDDNKINQLKQIVPECFEDGKINFDTLRQNLGDWAQDEDDDTLEHFGLFWPGKKQARKLAAIPSEGTLEPVFGEGLKPDGTPDTDGKNDSKNIFIEGENLEVLKILQKSYANRIKMIYIDPPYNTGNDFVYDDDFTEPLQEYLRRTGQIDEEGKPLTTNKRSDGRFHSKWLSMMYPRLRLARNLLKDDGVIFVSIDDNEVHNLRAIMNEIFGEENFTGELVWKKRVSPANDSQWFSSDHEYILVYSKDKTIWYPNRMARTEKQNSYYKNPDNDPRGPWNSAAYTCNKSKSERPNLYYPIINPYTQEEVWPRETAVWAYSKETHEKHLKEDILYWGADGNSNSPRKKQFLSDAKKVVNRSFLDHSDVGSTQSATLDFLKLFNRNYFNYTKPLDLIKRLILIATDNNRDEIILDFFAGSGTTALSVLELNQMENSIENRKFICIQLPEELDPKDQAYKDGFRNISDITVERIKRTISSEKIKDGFRIKRLTISSYKKWQDVNSTDVNQVELALDEFANSPLKPDWSKNKLLTEIQLLEGFPLDSKLETTNFGKNEVNQISHDHLETKLLICLDNKIEENLISDLKLDSNTIFICLDTAISNQDKLRLSDKGLIKTI